MATSSTGSVTRAAAAAAIRGSSAWRATLPSTLPSWIFASAVMRTPSYGDAFATAPNCRESLRPSTAAAASASLSAGALAIATSFSPSSRFSVSSRSVRASRDRYPATVMRAIAARRTRTSSSEAASSAITPQCSASSGSSATPARRMAGSGLRYLGWGLKRSRKDMRGALRQSGNQAARQTNADQVVDRRPSGCDLTRLDQPVDSCESHSAICSRVMR
jgi:hypothetical protein